MKTVCKKLFSLMLVAALLVSAIPFQASAASVTCNYCGSTNIKIIPGTEYTVPATCTTPGTDVYVCQAADCAGEGKWQTTQVAALGHRPDWSKSTVTKQPTCTEAGYETVKCDLCDSIRGREIPSLGGHDLKETVVVEAICGGSGTTKIECTRCDYETTGTIDALEHQYTSAITTPATCIHTGIRTYTCRCGDSYTEEVPATGIHDIGADGKCKVEGCEATDGVARFTVMFNDEYGTNSVKVFKDGETISIGKLPEGSLEDGKEFVGWYNGSSKLENLLQNGKWHAGMPTSFTAKYIDSDDDGVSKLYVYVRFYVKGVQQGYTQLLLDPVTFKDGDNMFNWLQSNKGTIGDAIARKDIENKYQWYPEYFYDYTGNEILTEQDLIADGDQSVVVKAYSKKATEANVLLYVHTSRTSTPAAIYEMEGYTAGNTVTLAAVKTELKNKYSVTEGLYSDKAWTDMLNGLNPMAVNGIDVADNGTMKIHVLAKGASSNADSSNPKTGDYITVAATSMVLAAAAFVAMVEMKKRKMI